MIAGSVLDELRRITDPARVRTDVDTIHENSTDAPKVFHPADVIVFPETASEVSEIVKLANRERVPIVSRGGRVGFPGGAIPIRGGFGISTRALNRIPEINRVALLAA